MYIKLPIALIDTALSPVHNGFDAGKSITRASGRGLGPGNLDIFGPQMAIDAISKGQKRPPACPRNGFSRIKTIMYRAEGRINQSYR
jgi:hypothetical protein